jgi:hypothetical protein
VTGWVVKRDGKYMGPRGWGDIDNARVLQHKSAALGSGRKHNTYYDVDGRCLIYEFEVVQVKVAISEIDPGRD